MLCVIHGPTAGRRWEASAARKQLHHAAAEAGVRRRFASHQLRHAHAVEISPGYRPELGGCRRSTRSVGRTRCRFRTRVKSVAMTSARAADDGGPRFDDLRALFVNCTLKRSPEPSNTDGLIELSSGIMRRRGVMVDV